MHIDPGSITLRRRGAFALLTALVVLLSTTPSVVAQGTAADSAAVVAVVEGFHAAMARGDSLGTIALLTDDAVILESGGIETRKDYRSGHLRADIGFATAVNRESGAISVVVVGDVAWATSTSVSQGEWRGRTIDSRGAELAVLTRQDGSWKIRAVHWSSRARRPG